MTSSFRDTFLRTRTTILVATVLSGGWQTIAASQAAPPADQAYVGTKKCASCHFEQYMTWKKTKHALSFENLPATYKTNTTCLKCHSTGYGAASGFKDAAATPDLVGNSCENCHGPGSEHCKIAAKFEGKKTLTSEEQQQAKGSIWRSPPDNVRKCHMAVIHKATNNIPRTSNSETVRG